MYHCPSTKKTGYRRNMELTRKVIVAAVWYNDEACVQIPVMVVNPMYFMISWVDNARNYLDLTRMYIIACLVTQARVDL